MRNVDLGEIEDISPLPKGNYRLAAKKWKEKKSKNDNTYIKVEYQVLEPELYKNWVLWENFTISAHFALVRIKRWVKATGCVPGTLNAKLLDELKGKPFSAKVDIEEYYPFPPQNKITDFVPPEDLDDADELTSQDTSKSSDFISVSDKPYDDLPF
ncbi:uncharacterized protein METZ01_LOCUS362766 [marine metagenome]|uniref:DUF669 domain-containing protein n=1 Tax=marine metagenome TaxID=408172 RepID=A0A382SK24_9ZZZZ